MTLNLYTTTVGLTIPRTAADALGLRSWERTARIVIVAPSKAAAARIGQTAGIGLAARDVCPASGSIIDALRPHIADRHGVYACNPTAPRTSVIEIDRGRAKVIGHYAHSIGGNAEFTPASA